MLVNVYYNTYAVVLNYGTYVTHIMREQSNQNLF